MVEQQSVVLEAIQNGGVGSWSMQMMGQIFGPLGGAGPTLFSLSIGYFNIAMLTVGGVLFFYNVTAGLLQTAHEGEVLGRRWSSLWAPIRVIFAIGLMTPMPNLGGYSAGQAAIAQIVRGSTALASLIWTKAVPALLDGDVQIVASTPTLPTQFLREAWNMSACLSVANYQLGAAASTVRVVVTQVEHDNGAVAFFTGLSRNGEATGICGSLATPSPPTHLAQPARAAFAAAHTEAIAKLLSTTGALSDRALQSSLSRDGQPLSIADELRSGLIAANAALLPVAELVKEASASEGQQRLREYIGNDTGQGWLAAGSYYLVLARLHQEASSVLSARPTVLTPARYIFESTGSSLDAAASGRWQGWLGNANAQNLPLDREEVQRIGSDMERAFARASATLSSFGFALPDPALAAALSPQQGEGGSIWDAFSAAVDGVGRQLAQQVALHFAPDSGGSDPLVGLVSLGQFLVGAAASLLGTLAVASAVPMLGASITTAMVVVGPLVLAMTVTGAAMSILLPAMPFVLWVLAVFGYFLAVVVAIVGAPLWALAHLRLDGEGIAHDSAKPGYLLLLRLALTPVLMVIGFFAAMAVFRAVAGLIGVGIYYLLSSFGGHPIFWLVSVVIMTVLTVAIFLIVIERSFSLVTALPNAVLTWIGGGSNNDEN